MAELILIFATLFISVALSQVCNICLLLIYLGILTKYIKNPDTFDKAIKVDNIIYNNFHIFFFIFTIIFTIISFEFLWKCF
jgi:hypothetical protein